MQTLIQMLRTELDYSWQVAHFALIEHRSKQEQILSRVEAWHGKELLKYDPKPTAHHEVDQETHRHINERIEDMEDLHSMPQDMVVADSSDSHGKPPQYVSHGITNKSAYEDEIESELQSLKRKKFEKDKSLVVRDIEEMLEEMDRKEAWLDEQFKDKWSMREAHRFHDRLRRMSLQSAKWFFTVREPERKGPLTSLSHSWAWLSIVNLMIMANSIFMVYTADYTMSHLSSADPSLPMTAKAVDMFFFVFFFVEVSLRIVVHRLYFFINADMSWNIFDFCLTMFSILDAALSWTSEDDPGLNVIFLRSFRILRIARTLRVIRILRFASKLRRMLQSVVGSLLSLVWAFVMLFFVFFIAGIALVQSVSSSLMAADSLDMADEDIEKLFDLFGSVYEASLSFYIASCGGAAWNNYFRLLEQVSSFSAAMFIVVIGFVQFALLNILTGIFVENAMKVAKPDREDRALEQRRAELKDINEFRECLKELDVDCSGSLTLDEFQLLKNDPRAHAMFSAIGLNIKDAELFFHMVCKSCKTSEVDFEFLIDACMKMKGYATSLDANAIMYRLQLLDAKVGTVGAQMTRYEKAHEERENRHGGLFSALAMR